MKYFGNKHNAGFGLVEAIFSLAIFIASVTVAIGGYIYSQQETINSSHRAQAVMLAGEGLEATKLFSYDDFSTLADGTYGLLLNETGWELTPNPQTTEIYTRSIIVSTIDTNRKQVTVTVSYDNKSISQTTQLTQWGRDNESVCSYPVPTKSGSVSFPSLSDIGKVQTQGNYAYFLSQATEDDLIVVDISDATAPEQVATLSVSGDPTNIFILGNYAYITTTATSEELVIVNISNPASPWIAGSYDRAGSSDATGVYVVGNIAYITSVGDAKLTSVNVSNPGSPVLVGALTISDSINEVVVQGNYAYAVTTKSTSETQSCHSVSDKTFYIPLKPSSSGTYPTKGSSSDSVTLNSWGKYSEGYLWIDLLFSGLPTGFHDAVLSVTFEDLDLIHQGLNSGSKWVYLLEAFTLTDEDENVLAQLRNVHSETEIISGNRVTICHKYITSPEVKYQNINSLAAHLNHGDHLGVCLGADDVNYDDPDYNGAFTWQHDVDNALVDGTSLSLKALLESHIELFYGDSIALANTSEAITDISVCGLSGGGGGDGELLVIDLTIPNIPALIATLPLTPGAGSADSISIFGSTLYVSQGSYFHTVNISTPNAPSLSASLDVGGTISDIALGKLCEDNFVAVSTYNDSAELQIIDVTSPNNIFVSGLLDLDGNGSLNGVAYNTSLDRIISTESEVDSYSLTTIAPN